ncbi:hypothetical protein PENTCL1PPCAC_28042 [Pristionchus entomophagus]|uniref:Uncharacterized protein n=1 Tax=Pristionchus entomophagus TaxID=358040 RepID=A0AAV5UGP2_9BILA|nr:hypothetical protein PENTCL1PPCAC_28042 [Pristionchus entomophagus]
MTIMLSTSPMEYTPTLYAWLILIFCVFPLIGLSYKVISTVLLVILRVLYSVYLWIYYDADERGNAPPVTNPLQPQHPKKVKEDTKHETKKEAKKDTPVARPKHQKQN